MTDPFYPAKPGDPITAEKWNDMQVKLRDEISSRISSHAHTGSAEGRKLTGDGIDPSSSLKVNQLDAAVSLSVKGSDVVNRFTALEQRATNLEQQKLPLSGGSITGTLSVSGTLEVRNSLKVTGQPNAMTQIEATGSGSWAEIDLNSTFSTADQKKWNIAVRGGDGFFLIRQLTDARGEKNIPLSIAPTGAVSVKSLNVTGDTIGGKVVSLSVSANIGAADTGVEFRHSNGTQGIGFGYNTIYTVGSLADQDLNLQARGNGMVRARVNPNFMQVERGLAATGKAIFLELFQSNTTTADVYPSIRFHHVNRYWNRIEASPERFHFKQGDLGNDAYIDLAVRTVYVNGADPATYGQEPIRIIRGFIQGGVNSSGTGYTSSWIAAGVCEVSYTRSYNSLPTVVATQQFVGTNNMAANTLDNAVVAGSWTNKFRVKTGDAGGNGTNRDFFFIVMGN